MNVSTTHLSSAALAVLLSLSGCLAEPVDADDIGERESEVTIGDPNYELIADLYDDPDFDVASQYARASALDGFGCSGFLISDDVYVNARHCRLTTSGATTISVTWGRYGVADANFDLATAEAKTRLESLGVPASSANLSPGQLKTWTCSLELSPAHRDIDYWRCQPRQLTWYESAGSGQWVSLNLLPGHLWGHYKVDSGSRPVGRRLYTAHLIQRCGDSTRNLVISTEGSVKDTDYGCVGFADQDPQHCFEHGLDTVQGSSGGAVVDKTTHQAYAVQQGQWRYWLGTANKVCSGWPSWQVANTATRFGPEVLDITAPGAVFQSGPAVGWGSEWIGGSGGNPHYSECPTGYAAAGVVGTTSSSGYLGNFGFVCVPEVGGLRLDESRVIAHGSVDVGFVTANGTDFNEYFNETLSSEQPSSHQQNLQMCPPGYFIDGLGGFAGNYVGKLIAIRCHNSSTGHSVARFLGDRFGANWDGMEYTWSSCPAGSHAYALFSNTGWLTDGLIPRCR
jgi:hypothetical protein